MVCVNNESLYANFTGLQEPTEREGDSGPPVVLVSIVVVGLCAVEDRLVCPQKTGLSPKPWYL